ncbi:hypothetical protein RIF29_19654 [Crotalaria pallida]|uniref:Uncharacterized protein n=1 Tax=Crotalaria pallida TaxID=3830 RepID=A0AAN9I5P0_CROPI
MTLLQAWIKEHFPNIGCAIPRKDYQEHMPRVLKWEVKNPFITNDQYRDRIRRIRELVHPMQMTGVLDKQAIQQILDLCDKPISEDVPCVVGMRGGRAERGSKAERAGRPERGGRATRGGRAEREGSRGVRGGIADRGNRAETGGRGELGGRAEKGGKAKRSDGRRVRARHH